MFISIIIELFNYKNVNDVVNMTTNNNMYNFSFKTTLCIQYPPNVIALVCILLTMKTMSKDTSYINIDSWEEFFFIRKEAVLSKSILKNKIILLYYNYYCC